MAVNRLLATILSRRGAALVDHAVKTVIAPPPGAPPRKSGVMAKVAEAALLRVAMRSVPGAIIIGGGLLARHLYERKLVRDARATRPLPTSGKNGDIVASKKKR